MNLVIPISEHEGPLTRQIYSGLRDAVLSGKLRAGERLPSTRELAEQLHVSRTVVLLAYDQLLAEGYASGRRGAGTYVTGALNLRVMHPQTDSFRFHLSAFGKRVAEGPPQMRDELRRQKPMRYDFVYGRSNIDIFPFESWRRLLLRNARSARVHELDYASAAGSPALKQAIAAHLQRSRGVVCDPSQVIIVNGSAQAIDLIIRVLVEPNDSIAVEDPGYQGARHGLRAARARLCPVPVDHDGIIPQKMPPGARMVFITPSHQFPTGAVLPLARRLALLDWAKRRRAVIIEDDYDGEFRYGGQALASLQGLDREGRVLYLGTFSRTIFPALRIGYVVAPRSLVPTLTAAKWISDRHTSTLEQQTLAEFLSSGLYERFLRRVRRSNSARRDALLDSIDSVFGNSVEITGQGAGAHIVLWPKNRLDEATIVSRAEQRGVGIYGISGHYVARKRQPGIILGFARLSPAEICDGIARLRGILDRAT